MKGYKKVARERGKKILEREKLISTSSCPVPSPQSPLPCSLLIVLCSLLIVLSCQTAPKKIDAVSDDAEFIPLEPGAFAYVCADVPGVRPFINLKDRQLQQMVDQTQYAVASLYLPEYFPNATRRYQLASWGSYPSSKVKMALGVSKDWEKKHSDIAQADYWFSAQGGLSVSMTGNRAFISAAAWDTPDDPPDPFSAAPGTAMPEGFNEFRKGALIACWFEKPAPLINKKLAEMEIPLEIPAERVFFCLTPAAGQTESGDEQRYEGQLRIEAASAAQTRALTSLFAIARRFLAFNASSFKADAGGPAALAAMFLVNPPVPNGKYLNIKTRPLSGGEISLLLSAFSLY